MPGTIEQETNDFELTADQERSVGELISTAHADLEEGGESLVARPPADVPRSPARPFYKRRAVLAAATILLLVGTALGQHYYSYTASHEATDDAFIDGHVVQISPQVTGRVAKIYVDDNQEVQKGDLLVEIDPSDYEAKLAQAQAALAGAIAKQKVAAANVGLTQDTTAAVVQQAASGVRSTGANVDTMRVQVDAAASKHEQAVAQIATAEANLEQARAQIAAAEAEATRAATDAKRYEQLYASDVVSRQQLDNATTAATTTAAQLDAARKRAASAEAQVAEARAAEKIAAEGVSQARSQVAESTAHVGEAEGKLAAANTGPQQVAVSRSEVDTASADIARARAEVTQAELELSYTKIYAPESGRITKKSVEVGAQLQVGQPLFAIVQDDLWVTANFKETQLDLMRPGQPVEIRIDAYSGLVLRGHVDSIQTGSGARFSLLPPENATGNYVKVVQRVPVKIVFDEQPDDEHVLGPGMSVEPEVRVR